MKWSSCETQAAVEHGEPFGCCDGWRALLVLFIERLGDNCGIYEGLTYPYPLHVQRNSIICYEFRRLSSVDGAWRMYSIAVLVVYGGDDQICHAVKYKRRRARCVRN